MGTPEEIADLLMWLSSPLSSFMTVSNEDNASMNLNEGIRARLSTVTVVPL